MHTLKTFYLRFLPLIGMLLAFNLSCQKSHQQSVKFFTTQENLHTFYLPTSSGDINFFQWPYNNILLDNTSDIFLFAEGLIQLGQTIQFDEEASHTLTRLGHSIISNFYNNPNNYRSYSATRSPYIKSMLAITEVDNESLLFQRLAGDINNALPAMINILNQRPLTRLEPIDDISNYNLSFYFDHLRNYFLDHIYNAVLENPSISDNLELIITRYIEVYMEVVDELQIELEIFLDQQNAITYTQTLTNVENAYDQFFYKFSLAHEDNQEIPQIRDAIANHIADENDRLNAPSIKTRPYIASLREALSRNVVSGLDGMITLDQAMSDYLHHQANQGTWWGDFTKEDWFGFKPFLKKANDTVVGYGYQLRASTNRWTSDNIAQPALDSAQRFRDLPYFTLLIEHANLLNNHLPDIARVIASIIYYKLESQITRTSAYDMIHHVIEQDLQASIFKDQSTSHTLPGIELSNITMQREGDRIAFVKTDANNITNGVTLGTAMSVLTERLESLEAFEDPTEDKNQLLFSLLNKSVTMLGYKTIEKSNNIYILTYPTSFFRPIYVDESQNRSDNLDVWDYLSGHNTLSAQHTTPIDCPPLIHTRQENIQRGYFAIPDRVAFEDDGLYSNYSLYHPIDQINLAYQDSSFSIDLEQQDTMVSTVKSQAELIRGASKILKYLRYDPQTLGDMGLMEYDGMPLFPFSHVFQLPLAIATINLHNLFRRGSVFYDDPQAPFSTDLPENFVLTAVHDVIEGEDLLYLTPPETSVQDITEDENSTAYLVRTPDLARLILAIEEFISMAQNLDDSQNSSDMSCMDMENHNLVKNSIDLFSHFSNSLGAFLMTGLQKEDGSFVDHYTLSQDTQSSTRSLESQIQAMHALIAIYRRIEDENIKASVFKSFHYTMENLFNDSYEGFYIVLEGSDEKPNIRLTTDIFRLLYQMDTLLEDNIYLRNELRNLRRRWTLLWVEQMRPIETALIL